MLQKVRKNDFISCNFFLRGHTSCKSVSDALFATIIFLAFVDVGSAILFARVNEFFQFLKQNKKA